MARTDQVGGSVLEWPTPLGIRAMKKKKRRRRIGAYSVVGIDSCKKSILGGFFFRHSVDVYIKCLSVYFYSAMRVGAQILLVNVLCEVYTFTAFTATICSSHTSK